MANEKSFQQFVIARMIKRLRTYDGKDAEALIKDLDMMTRMLSIASDELKAKKKKRKAKKKEPEEAKVGEVTTC